eukprot:jgi/Chlat1/4502/Chrsp29S04435
MNSNPGLEQMNAGQFKERMGALAFGNVLGAAARDYKKELEAQEKKQKQSNGYQELDMDELADDPELERLHRDRIMSLKKEAEKRVALQQKGHGELRTVDEPDFLGEVTGSQLVVAHFFHDEFPRCKIVDKHLTVLAPKHFGTKFIRIDVQKSPFFVTKLNVKVLPCVVLFSNGVAIDRIVGFEELGGRDDFPTEVMERRLTVKGLVQLKQSAGEDDNDDGAQRRSVYTSKDPDDEDSDFD